ncbi:hypothetical protein SOVF_127670, partial [Spinacia oleracea]
SRFARSGAFVILRLSKKLNSHFFSPICYAHLAANQIGQFMNFDDFSNTSSSQGGVTSSSQLEQ